MIQKLSGFISSGLLQPKQTAILTLSVATFFSTYFLEPFEIYPPEHTLSYFWICVFRAMLVGILAMLYLSFVRPKATWSIQSKLFHATVFLFLFGVVNFLIRDIIYDNPNNWSVHFFLTEIRNTFLIGILVLGLMFAFDHSRLLKKIEEEDAASDHQAADLTFTDNGVRIITQTKADDFLLPLNHFIMAKTEGNYTEIFTFERNGLRKQLKRIPLKSLEEQLSPYPWLVRTHRAYMVNQRLVENISGNAQGYQLTLAHYPEKVPVSRAFIPHFNQTSTLAT